MLGGAQGPFEETTSEEDGGSDPQSDASSSGCESGVGSPGGGPGQGKAREVELGWVDFGLDLFGKFPYGSLDVFLKNRCYFI